MKSRASPCPIDQISIICFKRCTYLRSFILKICTEISKSNEVPKAWKKATTILIHKKGDPNDPANFRPITLLPVTLKIFTSLTRDKIFEFLSKNKYVETHYQKGFSPGISGTFEHIAEMTHLINKSRTKQNSLTITLLDLRNAFGEVSHNLIKSVLQFHHLPVEVCNLVENIYQDFYVSITSKDFRTDYIKVGKGVLQGDCLSPLIFNMIINTFIQVVKQEKFTSFGSNIIKGFQPRNWFQFADDAAAVTSLEKDNQTLLNIFSRWCTWSDMLIRPDKCHSFGIAKKDTKSIQIKPKLYINNNLISPVEPDESFVYLGRHFDFKMSDKEHKEETLNKVKEILETIDGLPLHPKNKIQIYQKYLLSKISWHLTVTNIPITWIKNNIDNVVSRYVRSWLELPISGTMKIISLSKQKYGINFIQVSTRYSQCQTTFRNALKTSDNNNIRYVHNNSKSKKQTYDSYVSTKDAIKKIRSATENSIKQNLTTQSLVIKSIWDNACCKYTKAWSNVIDNLPRNIYSFAIRYLSNSLANNTNKVLWGIKNTAACLLCLENQTLGHVIGGCKIALNEKRYNWRHDSILINLANFLSKMNTLKIYCDVEGTDYHNPSIISGESKRPDMLIINNDHCIVLELTVGFETNMCKNSTRKMLHYKELMKHLSGKYKFTTFVNLSMGAIGVYDKAAQSLLLALKSTQVNETETNYIIKKLINICIRTTYYIFCQRDKPWNNPKLMSW